MPLVDGKDASDDAVATVRDKVTQLCGRFPVYGQ